MPSSEATPPASSASARPPERRRAPVSDRTVRLAHSRHGAGNAPTGVAVEAGYFADHGVDAEMVEVDRNSDAIALLEAGEVELVIAPGVSIIESALRGAGPLVVMSIENVNLFGIMAAQSVAAPDDLRGGAVGVSGPQDQDAIVLLRTLREWGLEPDVDVEVRRIPSRGAQFEALCREEIRAMAAPVPWPLLSRARGMPVLLDCSERAEPYQLGAIVTTRRFATERRQLLQDFMTAQLEGVRRFQADRDAALPHLRARSKIDDRAVLERTHRLFSDALEHHVPTVEPIAAVARDLALVSGRSIDLDLEALVDPSFVT